MEQIFKEQMGTEPRHRLLKNIDSLLGLEELRLVYPTLSLVVRLRTVRFHRESFPVNP